MISQPKPYEICFSWEIFQYKTTFLIENSHDNFGINLIDTPSVWILRQEGGTLVPDFGFTKPWDDTTLLWIFHFIFW